MTDIKLNTYIEWTDEDRAKGECPVPAGSDVTLWFSDGGIDRDLSTEDWDWGLYHSHITAYLVHSVPREPVVRWLIVGGHADACWYATKEEAEKIVSKYGGRIVKLVEVME